MNINPSEIEEGNQLHIQYNEQGLIPVVAQDFQSKQILMLAWTNEEALQKSIETGEAHYWSRSRQELWHKGATSGNIQKVHEILVDCDQDAIIMIVTQTGGGACHTGRPDCFYRSIDLETKKLIFRT